MKESPFPFIRFYQVPRDCADYNGVDGVHYIYVSSMGKQLQVSCEQGWTVLMRRTGPELNFSRSWVDYRDGFGDVAGDHWLGLEAFHHLTNQGNYSLMVEFGLPFSTYDADNDENIMSRNCADEFKGGWWYRDCTHIVLTGKMATMDCTTFYYQQFKHTGLDDGNKEYLLSAAVLKIKQLT
ncbi:angiopoietin-related protein 2-like [Lingula anatina]|uniref:Angiopoietin-related protein 2-like n=1 Tax=Lingula anatina TaxID=7574 RepID=A0A1S3I3S8_LINAN|nr:angiopoietin-related protein 2-like [Lingula anatina]|eukprot:XP_013392922.1 angiopoietin-related protein 2-like [Lingula anatina]